MKGSINCTIIKNFANLRILRSSKTYFMKPVFCFGELLLRMSPLPSSQWIHEACMPVYVGGAELNVAAALAAWGAPVQYCTALPQNALSADICHVLSAKQIDVSPIHFSGNRIGVYYLTQGADLQHSGVIYDRAYSSFSELQPGTINWDEVLRDAGWFHFSAISPALTANTAAVCKEALMAAVKKGIPISVDLNHRAKLWKWGKEPYDVMPELVEFCDLVMGNIWSANALLGIPVDANIHDKQNKQSYLQHANDTAQNVMKQFTKCKTVAQTFRFDEDNGIRYYATLNKGQQQYVSKEYWAKTIRDKVGSGDCFMAGLLYGLHYQLSPQNSIDFAAAAAIGKMNETGDNTAQTVAMVQQIINSHE